MSMVLFFGGTSLVETMYRVTDIQEVTQGIAIPLKEVNVRYLITYITL